MLTPAPHFNRACASVRQAITRNTAVLTTLQSRSPGWGSGWAVIQQHVDSLHTIQAKLAQRLVRIAVFGLVSRGKSALINALIGRPLLQTGPLNGVTQWTQSVTWDLVPAIAPNGLPLTVELVDTPGLDEIAGEARAELAQTVADRADLILFVVAEDITQTEYQALYDLRAAQKPIVLVFNKADLYPDRDRAALYAKLQQLQAQYHDGETAVPLLRLQDLVMVAARPAAVAVQVEWPDGRSTQEWETPPPQVAELNTALRTLLTTEGETLLALNALRQTQRLELEIARTVTTAQQTAATALINRFAQAKAIAIAVNPIGFLDVVGGAIADLVLIRSLARLYGLPMTGYEAGQLWRTILKSSGGVLLSELGSTMVLGLGKVAALPQLWEQPSSFLAIAGAMTVQAGAAGYGTYAVGRAAQVYLEQGCTWGPQGASTVVQEIIQQLQTGSALATVVDRATADERG